MLLLEFCYVHEIPSFPTHVHSGLMLAVEAISVNQEPHMSSGVLNRVCEYSIGGTECSLKKQWSAASGLPRLAEQYIFGPPTLGNVCKLVLATSEASQFNTFDCN